MKKHYKLLIKHISFIIILSVILDFFLDDRINNSVEIGFKEHPLLYSIFIVLIAPFFEELVFRFPLKFNSLNVLILPVLIVIFLNTDVTFVKLTSLLYLINIIIQRFFLQENKTIYITSIFCFTAIHIDNYDLLLNNLFQNILLLSPQFLLAVILTRLRINYSFKDAFIYHSTYNLILLLFAIISLLYE